MKLFFIHDTGQAKIGDEQVCVVLGRAEQQIFRLQVAMHDAVIVKVSHGGQCCAHQLGRISLVIAALAADAVEELPPECEVGDKVDYIILYQRGEPVLKCTRFVRLFMVSK